MIDEYSCRGLPEIDNFSLVREAEKFPYGKHPTKSQEKEGASTRGRSAPASDGKLEEKFDTLIDTVAEVAKQQKKLADGQSELREKHERSIKEIGDIKSRLGRDNRGDRDRSERDNRDRDRDSEKKKCKWCKQTGHFVSDCPDMLKAMKLKDDE